jgi:hypothetical protein
MTEIVAFLSEQKQKFVADLQRGMDEAKTQALPSPVIITVEIPPRELLDELRIDPALGNDWSPN